MILLDSHYHLDFLPCAQVRSAFLERCAERNIRVIGQTLTPAGFRDALEDPLDVGTDRTPLWSLGLHPWKITSERVADDHLDLFAEQVKRTRFVGEIGMDLSPRRLAVNDPVLQRRVFDGVLRRVEAAAQDASLGAPYVLSIHAVRSAGEVASMLSQVEGCGQTVMPVFHWFSGTSDELTALIRLGGMVSVNPRMFESKRGRAYLRQVPAERLLLESDLPAEPLEAEGEPHAQGHRLADELCRSLQSTLARLSEVRGRDMAEEIIENQARVYGV